MKPAQIAGVLLLAGAGVAAFLWYRATSTPAPVYWDTAFAASVRPRTDVAKR